MEHGQGDPAQPLLGRCWSWVVRRRSRLFLITATLLACIPIGWFISDLRHNQTVLVGLIAGLFAWGQWHTARQKLGLDLFEKRLEAYEKLRDAVLACQLANPPTMQQTFALDRSIHEMRFLFGAETVRLLRDLSELFFVWRTAESRFERACAANVRDENRIEQLSNEADNAATAARRASDELDPLMSPYLRMGQKLPRSPTEWPSQLNTWLSEKWRKD